MGGPLKTYFDADTFAARLMVDANLAVDLNDMMRCSIYSDLQANQPRRLEKFKQHYEAALLVRYATNEESKDGGRDQLPNIKSMLESAFLDLSALEDEAPILQELPLDVNTFYMLQKSKLLHCY